MLFGRPPTKHAVAIETVNDIDGLLANFWRAVKYDPNAVADYASNPVNECDLHARHAWLVREALPGLVAKLEGDPDYYDAKIAGWWVWGICCWIGSGWCSGNGPWAIENGLLVKKNAGMGINRKRPHLGGQGIKRSNQQDLADYFNAISDRLYSVRVCCGNWSRICGYSSTCKLGMTGVFLDPPYGNEACRDENLYLCDDGFIARDVLQWCLANGDNPLLRIALCGYEGEHELPTTWDCMEWRTPGGYGMQGNGRGRLNRHRERIWFSPYCLKSSGQLGFWDK